MTDREEHGPKNRGEREATAALKAQVPYTLLAFLIVVVVAVATGDLKWLAIMTPIIVFPVGVIFFKNRK